MSHCWQCGSPIPDGKTLYSMCFGDIDYGQDGYYRRCVEIETAQAIEKSKDENEEA